MNKIPELRKFLEAYPSPILALTESHVSDDFSLKPFVGYHSAISTNSARASIFVNKKIPHARVPLAFNFDGLEAVAVRIGGRRPFVLTCVYISHQCSFSANTMTAIASSVCGLPLVLAGDFNAHNRLWGSNRICPRGRVVEDFLQTSELVLLNDGSPTFFRPGYSSAIDLTLASPSLAPNLSWTVLEDAMQSDHFPILIDGLFSPTTGFSKRICTNWKEFARGVGIDLGSSSDATYSVFEEAVKKQLSACSSLQTIPAGCTSPSPELTSLIKQRALVTRNVQRSGDLEACIRLKKVNAKIRRLTRKLRRREWRYFCTSLTEHSPDAQVWRKLRNLRNPAAPSQPWYNLTALHKQPVSLKSVAEQFLGVFVAEQPSCTSPSRSSDCRNEATSFMDAPITPHELDHAISRLRRRSAPGPDGIPNSAFSGLPLSARCLLLASLNKIWDSAELPISWKTSHIVPIKKPAKPASELSSYRPITLSSCGLKLMERVVLGRLNFHLEANRIFPDALSGFRSHRSTSDNLVDLVSSAESGLLHGMTTLCVFVDLQSAFDVAPHASILEKLDLSGVGGKTRAFIASLLKDRYVQVRLGSTYSSKKKVTRGVPQGGVLSPTLFNLLLADLPSLLPESVEISIFADDIVIWATQYNLTILSALIQRTLAVLDNYCKEWGLVISPSKSAALPITRKVNLNDLSPLTISNRVIPYVTTHKYLGVTLDKRLTWAAHVDSLSANTSRRVAMLRCLTSTNWGTGTPRLLNFYNTFILAKLRYGNLVTINCCRSTMARLGRIQSAALRVCLGVDRTSPITAIEAEAFQPPLHLLNRRSLDHYLTSLLFWHPCHRLVEKLRDGCNLSAIAKFFRQESAAREVVLHRQATPFPTWTIPMPKVVLHHEGLPPRADDSWPGSAIRQVFEASVLNLHMPGVSVYTDGSLDAITHKGGAAFHIPHKNVTQGYHLIGATSSTTTELQAIQLALAWCIKNLVGDLVFFCDSKAAILTVISPQNRWKDAHLASDIHRKLGILSSSGRQVSFIWVPAHAGITPNEMADAAAKRARDPSLAVGTVFCRAQLSELKKRAHSYHTNLWRDSLLASLAGTFRGLFDDSAHPPPAIPSRRFETCLHRLRVGTAYTNSHLHKMMRAASPLCSFCGSEDTIVHFLLQCPAFNHIRDLLARKLTLLGLDQLTLPNLLGHHQDPRLRRAVLSALLDFLRLSGRFV